MNQSQIHTPQHKNTIEAPARIHPHIHTHHTYVIYVNMHANHTFLHHRTLIWHAHANAPPNTCNTLQHTATHCNTLQHTATHCNTLQHTAIHHQTHHTYIIYIHTFIHISRVSYTCNRVRICDLRVHSHTPPHSYKSHTRPCITTLPCVSHLRELVYTFIRTTCV